MFFQNVFNVDFIGVLLLADRQLSLDFKVTGNKNSSVEMINWVAGPHNLTGNTTLTVNYSPDGGYSWFSFAVNVASGAVSVGAVTANEIVGNLNADSNFSSWFSAEVRAVATSNMTVSEYVVIKATTLHPERWKAYLSNSGAEKILKFNKNAGVAEIPSFFEKHTIANRLTYLDSVGSLIKLDTSDATDQAIITAAGLDYTSPKADYQMLKGFSGMFTFTKNTVDGSNRITTSISYGAGAIVGDFAKKTTYTYTSANTTPDKVMEQPYTLTTGDLITP